jgi:HD-GYP domain-containing protein (c-di-GMP phosphodiesterase class II)
VATEIEEQRIDTVDLRPGMFVCRLDRPWEGTPFQLQGVELRTEADIRAVRELCKFVYIDARRELDLPREKLHTLPSVSANEDAPPRPAMLRSEPGETKPQPERKRPALLTIQRSGEVQETRFERATTYKNTTTIEDELPLAREALHTASAMVDRIYLDIASGRELSVDYVEDAVRPLVASVLRSADTFLYLEGMRRRDNYSYGHSISCSALAAAFGRHMGLHEDTIISLAAGGLLMDVGKTRVPETLLQYPGSLSSAEIATVRSHVEHGLDIVAAAGIHDQDVLDIVRTHHERHDGSGYPGGLIGSGIPVAGRMLGIIDVYDAMANVRPYRPAVSRHHALQHIYSARDKLFQAELVEQFQVCLGVYPTGSLVELNTGEVAVVTMQNQARRLRPRVLVLSTPNKQPLVDFQVFDLLAQDPKGFQIEIARGLAAGEYGVDAAEHFLR